MDPIIILVILLVLVGVGVGIYFLMTMKACKDHETQDDCKEPCQWDTYGAKCIDEDDVLTPRPPSGGGGGGGGGDGGGGGGGGATLFGYKKFPGQKIGKDTRLDTCRTKSLEECKTLCTYEQECLAFTHDGEKCCMYSGVEEFSGDDKTDMYIKGATGYTTDVVGNFTGDEVLTKTATSLDVCGQTCDETGQCHGFSYKLGNCVLKGANVSTSPILDGAQYYKRSASNKPGTLKCNSLAATNLADQKFFIFSNSGHEVPNQMLQASSYWHGDEWKDQGRIDTMSYQRTYVENDGTVAQLTLVPGRTDEYQIIFTYEADLREGGNKSVMLHGHGANSDDEIESFGTWVKFDDPLCRWKFFKKAGTENDYWIITNREHRAPCKMLKFTEDGLRGVNMDLTDMTAVWTLDPFTSL